MAKNTLGDLYESLKDEARGELLDAFSPKLDELRVVGDEILAVLNDGRRPKRPKAAKPSIAAPVKEKLTRKGALKALIRSVLVAAEREPLAIVEIRDELLKKTMYKDYDPQRLYTMVSERIGQMPGVKQVKHKYVVVG